jgi:spore coat polysaccharide biosynthesis protein SpsF
MKLNNVGAIIPVRFNSKRLPGKVLLPIAGKINIERIIERLFLSVYIKKVVLAIPENDTNEILDWYENWQYKNKRKKIKIYIGANNNLIGRCLKAAEKENLDIIIDLSQDLCFVDPAIVDILVFRLKKYNADYSSNVCTRSFPDGFDVQVYTKDIYKKIYSIIPKNHFSKKWTGWNIFYWRHDFDPQPRIINFEAQSKYYFPHWRLCLDTIEDQKIIENIYLNASKSKTYLCYQDIIKYILSNKNILNKNKNIKSTKLEKER